MGRPCSGRTIRGAVVGFVPVVAQGDHAFVERFREPPAHNGRVGQAEASQIVHRGEDAMPLGLIQVTGEQSGGDSVVPPP